MSIPPRLVAAVAVLVCTLLAACNGPPGGAAGPMAEARQPSSTNADQYVIGAGNSLSVFVYHNPDLSEASVAVRPDGRISTPLIDDIVAAGKTPTELSHDIQDKLKKYIQDPTVTVIVRGPSSGPPTGRSR